MSEARHIPAESGPSAALADAMEYDPGLAARYRREGLWRDELLTDWLDRTVAAGADRTAIVTAGGTLTFGELAALSDRLAAGLGRLGIGMGDVVGVQLLNGPYWIAMHLALVRIGAVMTGLHLTFREAECERALAFGGAKAIVCERRMGDFAIAETMLGLKDRLPALRHVIVAGGGPAGTVALESLEAEPGPPGARPDASGPFIMLYTSGSTSRPKAVPLSHNNLLTNARGSAGVFGIEESDRILAAGPFAHLYSLHSPHFSMLTGASQAILPSYEKGAFVDTVERSRPTVVFAVPAHILPCLAEGLLDTRDWSSIRLLLIAGAAVASDLVRALDAKLPNGRVIQLWGMTELQAGLYTRPDDPVDFPATTCGRPSPGTEIRIASGEGEALPQGAEGELQVRGASVFPGYFRDEDANAEAFTHDRWFRTGDLAAIDEHGNVVLKGRIKDTVNRGGVKYATREIEELLLDHPEIDQAAVVPAPHPRLGEIGCAFAVARGDGRVTLDGLCDWLLDRGIAKYKLPERLELVAEMPLGPSRKIDQETLKAMAAGSTETGAGA